MGVCLSPEGCPFCSRQIKTSPSPYFRKRFPHPHGRVGDEHSLVCPDRLGPSVRPFLDQHIAPPLERGSNEVVGDGWGGGIGLGGRRADGAGMVGAIDHLRVGGCGSVGKLIMR